MSPLPAKPPPVDAETQPFWDATKEGRLCLPRCRKCDFVIFYPRSRCPRCRSHETDWTDLSGLGEIYSCTVVRRAPGRWKEHVPYVVAYVQLAEGPRLVTNIVGCDPEDVTIGMPVRVRFEPAGDEGYALPRFEPCLPAGQPTPAV